MYAEDANRRAVTQIQGHRLAARNKVGGEDKKRRLERPKGGNEPSQLAEGWPTEATLTPSFGEGASEFPQVRSTFQPNALSTMEVWY